TGGNTQATYTISAGSSSVSFRYYDETAGTYNVTLTNDASLTNPSALGFTVNPAAATKLVFTTQPGGTITGGTAFSQQPVVKVEDAGGNVVTSDSSTQVTLAIGTNPSSGTLTCTTNPVTVTNGVATFAGCKIDKAGSGYTLVTTNNN